MTTHTTATDVLAAITEAIENGDALAAEYNLDNIFDTCFEFDAEQQAFIQTATTDEFWAAVEANALTEFTVRFPDHDAPATVHGWEDEEIDGFEFDATEDFEPEAYAAAARKAGWALTNITPTGATATRI